MRVHEKTMAMANAETLMMSDVAGEMEAVQNARQSVMLFCSEFRPAIGGAERQAEKLAAALVKAGCRVTVLTPRIDPGSPDREEADGVCIERFPFTDLSRRFPLRGVALVNIFYILWQVVRAVRQRLKSGYVILQCHTASLQTVGAALAGRMAGVPVLCKAATAGRTSDFGEIEKNGSSGKLVAWLARKSIQTWVATTASVDEAMVRAGIAPQSIVRIPNGVDLVDHHCVDRPIRQVKRFLYLGRLSTNARRDVPTLIRAFDRLARDRLEIELAIVGDGNLFEKAHCLARGCASSDRIHMPGFDHPRKWLAWADCFVLPSRLEGLSNALLEAMAEGLPCIANDIPSNREVLNNGKAGILVPLGDLDALEKAMRRLAEEIGVARHYACQGKQRVEQCYSIGAVAEKYLTLYRALHAGGAVK
jgi:glycosyltransferase involved in cell wall biosynthesis